MIVEQGIIPSYRNAIDGLAGDDFTSLTQEETWREDHPNSPHKDTTTVYLNMPDITCEADVFEALETHTRQILVDSPLVQEVILDCMALVGACKLGRTMLINLKPQGVIEDHVDEGGYCAVYRRYHLPIITNGAVEFNSDGERYTLKEGILYELENKKIHSVYNMSTSPRLHLVMDMQLISEL